MKGQSGFIGGRIDNDAIKTISILLRINEIYKERKRKMKTWEAIKAADEGKKIRRRYWMKGVYSIKEESSWAGDTALVTRHRRGTCECVSLERIEWDDIFADDWEIYEEEENERTDKSFAK